MSLDKTLHDILNAGIALFRSGEDSVNNAIKEVQRTFDELKEKGASDTSEQAVKLRKTLDDIVTQANDLGSKAGSAYTEQLKNLEALYEQAMTQMKGLVPEDQVNQIKDKIDELQKVINERLGRGGSTSGGAGGASV